MGDRVEVAADPGYLLESRGPVVRGGRRLSVLGRSTTPPAHIQANAVKGGPTNVLTRSVIGAESSGRLNHGDVAPDGMLATDHDQRQRSRALGRLGAS